MTQPSAEFEQHTQFGSLPMVKRSQASPESRLPGPSPLPAAQAPNANATIARAITSRI